MSRRRSAAVLGPLALLSTAWTASLLDGSGSSSSAAEVGLPEGVALPAVAVEAPASYSRADRVDLGVGRGELSRVVAAASRGGIPAVGLAAYQRAETVMGSADERCGVEWELLAAIGRVESDHGHYGGSAVGADGALVGSGGTARIVDTDAAQFDRDVVFDRGVGPMQFIPSTWSEVGVDADGDGKRDPQDVDDAALASAVYLCSGREDLGTVAGRRAAVYRYNRSWAYVDLVLSVREGYVVGEYASVPGLVTSAVRLTSPLGGGRPVGPGAQHGSGGAAGGSAQPGVGTPSDTSGPSTSSGPGGPSTSEPSRTGDPVAQVQETVRDTAESTSGNLDETVTTVLSLSQAILACTSRGLAGITAPTRWNACIDQRTGG